MYTLFLLLTIALSITNSAINGMDDTTPLLPNEPIIHFIQLPGYNFTQTSITIDHPTNTLIHDTCIMNIWLVIKRCCLCNCCDNT